MTLKILFNPFTGNFDYVPDVSTFASWTPTLIAAGATFTIPANVQVLFYRPIQVDGVLKNDGLLVSVN